jgi:hypothetical protein
MSSGLWYGNTVMGSTYGIFFLSYVSVYTVTLARTIN